MDNKDNSTDGKIAVVTSISESGGVQVEYYDKNDPIVQEIDREIDYPQMELDEKMNHEYTQYRINYVTSELESLGFDYKECMPDDEIIENLESYLEPKLSLARLGRNISKAREVAGFSQEDLARYLHTNRQQISRYELADQEMSVLRLVHIAKALHVSPESLLKGVDLDP